MRGTDPVKDRRFARCGSWGISALPVHCQTGVPAGSPGALPRRPSHCRQRFRGDGHGVDWVSRISRRNTISMAPAPLNHYR